MLSLYEEQLICCDYCYFLPSVKYNLHGFQKLDRIQNATKMASIIIIVNIIFTFGDIIIQRSFKK